MTTCRGEECRAEVMVGQQHGYSPRQHRHDRNEQVGGDQPAPDKQWHAQQRHGGCAQIDDGDDHVDRAENRGNSHQVNGKDHHGKIIPILQHQRRIHRPPRPGRTAGDEKSRQQEQESERQNPEAEVVQARQRHIGRADLQRYHPVRESRPSRHDCAKDHDQPVHGRERVEKLRIQKLQPRLKQLQPDQHREGAADQPHQASEKEVHRADVLVIRGIDPAAPATRHVVVSFCCDIGQG
jgi:hypothetical protein